MSDVIAPPMLKTDSRVASSGHPIGPLAKPKVILGAPVVARRYPSSDSIKSYDYEHDRQAANVYGNSQFSRDEQQINGRWEGADENEENDDECDVFDMNPTESAAEEPTMVRNQVSKQKPVTSINPPKPVMSTNQPKPVPPAISLNQQTRLNSNLQGDSDNVFKDVEETNDERPLSPWSRDMLNYNQSLSRLDLDLEDLRSKIRSLSLESRKKFVEDNRHILLKTNDPELLAAAAEGEPDKNEEDAISPELFRREHRLPSDSYLVSQMATKKMENNLLNTYGAEPRKPQGLVGPYPSPKYASALQPAESKTAFLPYGSTGIRSVVGIAQNVQRNLSSSTRRRTYTDDANEGEPDMGDEPLNESLMSNTSGFERPSPSVYDSSLINFRSTVDNNVIRPIPVPAARPVPLINPGGSNDVFANIRRQTSQEYGQRNFNNGGSSSVAAGGDNFVTNGMNEKALAGSRGSSRISNKSQNDVNGSMVTGGQPMFASSSVSVAARPIQHGLGSRGNSALGVGESMPNLATSNGTRVERPGSQSMMASRDKTSEPKAADSFAVSFDNPVRRRVQEKPRASRPLSQPVTVSHISVSSNNRASVISSSQDDPVLRGGVRSSHKSNRHIIVNALSFSCLAGPANERVKMDVLQEIARSDATNFIVLFRDSKLQFRSVYTFNSNTDELTKLYGLGPKQINNSMIEQFYKYDSGCKEFIQIKTTKHVGVTVDGIVLLAHFWKNRVSTTTTPRKS